MNAPDRTVEGDSEQLIARAKDGDRKAFEALYRANVDNVYGLCLRLNGGHVARAEDHTQQAFIRAWEKLDQFRGDAKFGTWLHRLTANVVLGAHRRRKTFEVYDEASHAETSAQQANDGLHTDLERQIARLPARAREVLVLFDVYGYRHEEISNMLGIAVGSCKAHLHRARRLMQENMNHATIG